MTDICTFVCSPVGGAKVPLDEEQFENKGAVTIMFVDLSNRFQLSCML